MPYGYFISQFGKSSIKGYDGVDLSNYKDKRLLIGYGTYDIKDENCRYLDVNSSTHFDRDFQKRFVFDNQTFAISREPMSFNDCLELVARYNGYIFTPSRVSQAIYLRDKFGYEEDIWLGYRRENCSTIYKNHEDYEQSYENFAYPFEVCSDSKLNSYMPKDSLSWLRTDSSYNFYCPIKINSPDYRRPIKACLPWWRVERSWKIDKDSEFFEFDGQKIDLRYAQYVIDYPKEAFICTEFEDNNSSEAIEIEYEVSCKTYDSINISPTCIEDINQDICRVNECKGYLEDSCQKIDTFSPYKDYEKGVIYLDGQEKYVKAKQNIEQHIYKCSRAKKESSCLKKEQVIVIPAHCPGSECDELSHCLKNSSKSASECIEEYPCEKSYGSVDNLEVVGGTTVGLRGKCSSGEEVVAPINQTSKLTKVCKEHDKKIVTTTKTKSCIFTADHVDMNLSVSITEDDRYLLDDRCVRMNNIEESRPSVESIFSYENRGFFKTSISKVYIDKSSDEYDTNSSIEYLLNYSKLELEEYSLSKSSSVSEDDTKSFCDATFSDGWLKNRLYSLHPEASPSVSSVVGFLHKKSSSAEQKCRDGATLNLGRCQRETPACSANYNSGSDKCIDSSNRDVGFSCGDYESRENNICYEEPWYAYDFIALSSSKSSCDSYASILGLYNTNARVFFDDYDFASLGITPEQINNKTYCIAGGDALAEDAMIRYIKKDDAEVNYYFEDNTRCSDYAKCLGGEKRGSSGCHILVDDNRVQEDPIAQSITEYSANEAITYSESNGSFVGEINGYSDIYAIEEYVDGDFGYISNYLFELPKNNVVKLSDKEISPIIEHGFVLYDLLYDNSVAQNTEVTKNKSPTNRKTDASGLKVVTTYIGDGKVLDSEFMSSLVEIVLAPFMSLVGSSQRWGWYDSSYQIYQKIESDMKYVPNVYGYDPRVIEHTNMVWDRESIHGGTFPKPDYLNFRSNIINSKKSRFALMGFDKDVINDKLISSNEKNSLGWAGAIKWYKPSGREKEHSPHNQSETVIVKPVNTIYMGAVNSLAIVVPYKGSYELKAYDKNDNLLASKVVSQNDFLKNIPTTSGNIAHDYAKVYFATSLNFNIANNQNRDLDSGSCLGSSFVEWGGGVSGAYYEQGVPDIGEGKASDCLKSDDAYVKSHSATQITLRATNSTSEFVIPLKKPMPYPNRVVLIGMQKEERREYRCWKEIEQCEVN
jgi:hypothetical protein